MKKGSTKGMRPEKKSAAEEFRSQFKGSGFVIVADYKGLTVAKTTELRKRLKGAQAKMQVVRNRMFGRVATDLGYPDLGRHVKGPSAMFFGNGDVVQVAKVLKDFHKENQKPVVRAGAMGGAVLSAADVEHLAGLPSREVLLGHLVGTIAAPMSSLVGVLNQKLASVVYVLKAIEEKKSKASG